jgi:DNA polymerase-4
VGRRLREQGFCAKTVCINVRNKDLFTYTHQKKLENYTDITKVIQDNALILFKESYNWSKPIRSIGVSVSDLAPSNSCSQISLFEDEKTRQKLCKDYMIQMLQKTLQKG